MVGLVPVSFPSAGWDSDFFLDAAFHLNYSPRLQLTCSESAAYTHSYRSPGIVMDSRDLFPFLKTTFHLSPIAAVFWIQFSGPRDQKEQFFHGTYSNGAIAVVAD